MIDEKVLLAHNAGRHARDVGFDMQGCWGRLSLRAWDDDLVAVLFEFLDDDTKLAQSCTDWLHVQHWYTVVPEPSMCVTLWALMGAGGNCHEHMQDTPLHFLAFLGFSHSRSVCHGPLRQQALFRTCLALFRDIFLFLAVIWDQKSLAAVRWHPRRGRLSVEASLVQLSHKIHSHGFCLSLCCQIGPVFSVPLRHQTSSHRRHGLGILRWSTTAGYVMLTNTFYRAFCSCKCRIRPCICPLHAWWISRMTNFECLSCLLALPFGTVEMTNFECVLCSCSSVQLPMIFSVRHESKQLAPEWMEAPFTTPSSC